MRPDGSPVYVNSQRLKTTKPRAVRGQGEYRKRECLRHPVLSVESGPSAIRLSVFVSTISPQKQFEHTFAADPAQYIA